MKLTVCRGIELTQEQVIEIGKTVMQKPDMGWKHASDGSELPRVYAVSLSGEHGTYEYRVVTDAQKIILMEVTE